MCSEWEGNFWSAVVTRRALFSYLSLSRSVRTACDPIPKTRSGPCPYTGPVSSLGPHGDLACLWEVVVQTAESALARFSGKGRYRLPAPRGISGRQRTQPGPSTAGNKAHCAGPWVIPAEAHCCSHRLARGAGHGTVDIPVAVPENPRVSASVLARAGSSRAGSPTPGAHFTFPEPATVDRPGCP